MNKIRAKYVFQGIALSAIGAFLWEMFYFRWIYEGRDKLLVILLSAVFGLLMASIYLVPLGAVLGVMLPPIALHKPLGVCLSLRISLRHRNCGPHQFAGCRDVRIKITHCVYLDVPGL